MRVPSEAIIDRRGPSRTEWSTYRKIIIELYSKKPLDHVRSHMLDNYGFQASARMYRSRLKEWGALKNWKSYEKDQYLKFLETPGSLPSRSIADLDEKSARKLKRYSRTRRSNKRATQSKASSTLDDCSTSSDSSNDKGTVSHFTTVSPVSPRQNEAVSLTHETELAESSLESSKSVVGDNSSQMDIETYDTTLFGWGAQFSTPTQLPHSIFITDVDVGLQTINLILKSMQSIFAGPLVYQDPQNIPDGLIPPVLEPTKVFWDDIAQAMYLFKVQYPGRAWSTIHKACKTAPSIDFATPLWLQSLFAILSPVNTKLTSSIRTNLLRYLCALAEARFGTTMHPIVTIVRLFEKDAQTRDISERSLAYMLDVFTAQIGSYHPLTIKTQTELIKLIRRDRDFGAARTMARKLLSTTTTNLGTNALGTRKAARQLEHVLMDSGDWASALQLCFLIVGQPSSLSSADAVPSPAFSDECALYTMEDIAKIYDAIGEQEKAMMWLKQALIKSWSVWPHGSVEVQHMRDKLEKSLVTQGRGDEVLFWRISGPG
ncbi:hypothetical protein M501DRAFT_995691 [Patellaria atrata CBS 101060]|uniref:Clr5 domain-containing protein n=1 Tax=Patellaria atrata CBS 101060 TaxID=1346257 RepID=A0A9P4VPW2_9PEZI|nr:hypothetical protein M501DRAFT_995691 [Patellaria atrata CBS 101060]